MSSPPTSMMTAYQVPIIIIIVIHVSHAIVAPPPPSSQWVVYVTNGAPSFLLPLPLTPRTRATVPTTLKGHHRFIAFPFIITAGVSPTTTATLWTSPPSPLPLLPTPYPPHHRRPH